MNGLQERACVHIYTHSLINQPLIFIASVILFCSIIRSFIHLSTNCNFLLAIVHLHSLTQSFHTRVFVSVHQAEPFMPCMNVCVCVYRPHQGSGCTTSGP